LATHARSLAEIGVRRINVSMDSLDPGRFKARTRIGDLGKVLCGIDAALEAGLKVKINAVALKGVNDNEFDDLIRWCGERGCDLGPARYTKVEETGQYLGFITPLTHNFCEGCNRVRLTCTGTLYMCLGQEDAADLREPLRASGGDDALVAAINEAIARKPKGHDFVIDRRSNQPALSRHMSVTGG
jgi:cyclic pyranopterin phosphate synthase